MKPQTSVQELRELRRLLKAERAELRRLKSLPPPPTTWQIICEAVAEGFSEAARP